MALVRMVDVPSESSNRPLLCCSSVRSSSSSRKSLSVRGGRSSTESVRSYHASSVLIGRLLWVLCVTELLEHSGSFQRGEGVRDRLWARSSTRVFTASIDS